MLLLELTIRAQAAEYLAERIRTFSNNEDIPRREGIVQLDLPAVVFQGAYVIVAHHGVFE